MNKKIRLNMLKKIIRVNNYIEIIINEIYTVYIFIITFNLFKILIIILSKNFSKTFKQNY